MAIPAALSLIAGGVLLTSTPAFAVPVAIATPASVTLEEFATAGVQITGESADSGGPIQRQDIEVVSPAGQLVEKRDFTSDGTFDVVFTASDFTPADVGTYSVTTAGGVINQDQIATTTFEVTAAPAAPPASITVDPGVISPDAFIADGVQASGLTFDNGAPVNRSDLVLTSPTGATASYFDLTGDGTFDVNIKPKGDVLTQPLALGTYTLRATSLLQPTYTASTTFVVEGVQAQPDPFVVADPEQMTVSDFLELGVNLSGFVEDTPGTLTRQEIFVTTPGGDRASYPDFTGDGTFNVQVYPQDAPDEGPEGQRAYSLGSETVEIGVYQVESFGFIRPDARATTSFEVIADPVPPVDPPIDGGDVGNSGADAGSDDGSLAATGAATTGLFAALAAVLALLGGVATYVGRRRSRATPIS